MDLILSNDAAKIAKGLKNVIAKDKSNIGKLKMIEAQNYYQSKHDILNHRIFYFDTNGILQEDKYASNFKIVHSFFAEQVDQKVQYLLSNPVSVTSDDNKLQEYLSEYWNDDAQLFLQEVLEGASINGKEYAYAATGTDDKVSFQTASALNTLFINDTEGNVNRAIYYTVENPADNKKNQKTKVLVATETLFYHFVSSKNGDYKLDDSISPNPRQHVIAKSQAGKTLSRNYGMLPFFKLSNNRHELSDLAPIKALIDDYDIIACYLSNNLQDFNDALYVVTGYPDQDLGKLQQNIRNKKMVGIPDKDGGVEIKTINIPYEARKAKLEIDQEAIYKFGMAFNSAQLGDGNITNVVIKSRYALLDLKANKAEVRLRRLIAWMNRFIIDDINRRYGTAFDLNALKVEITRESVIDTKEIADIELVNAQAKESYVQSILAVANFIDDESTLRLICEQFDLDYDEVANRVEEEDYSPSISVETDPVVGDENVDAN